MLMRLPWVMWPSLRMSARRPPRWMSGRSSPGPWSRSRWAQGSARRSPRQSDVADGEVAADEGVDVDAAGEDVASGAGEVEAGVAGGEFFDHFGGDQGQLVAGPVRAAGAERAGAVRRSGRPRGHDRRGRGPAGPAASVLRQAVRPRSAPPRRTSWALPGPAGVPGRATRRRRRC